MLLRAALKLDIDIEPTSEGSIDRTLNSTRFRVATGYAPPTWNAMAQELAGEWQASQ
jgi:dTDP-4-dehydrorhamnose reductase